MADEQLPLELALFEDSARTIEFNGCYEMELTEAEAQELLTYAMSHEMRHLERDLRAGDGRIRVPAEGGRSEVVNTLLSCRFTRSVVAHLAG
jgi:hypothetical protein